MKREGRKDRIHEPYFKGRSNEALQRLKEDSDLVAFLL